MTRLSADRRPSVKRPYDAGFSILLSNPAHRASSAPALGRGCPGEREAGFSLIEVLVTALIVALLASATAKALISTSHTSGDQRLRSQADAVAAQDQERLRGLSDEQLSNLNNSPNQTHDQVIDINGQKVKFTISSSSAYQDASGASSCTSGQSAFYKVLSQVSWTEGYRTPTAQTQSLTAESLISRPVTGELQVNLKDQTSAALPGASVTATASGASAPLEQGDSDASGCTLFAGLASGAYAVGVSKSGYVDPNGSNSPTSTATLHNTDTTAQTPATSPFYLGLAGAATVTLSTINPNNTSPVPTAQADGVSWTGSGSGGLAMSTPGAQPASVTRAPTQPTLANSFTTPTKLFPFANTTSGTASYTNNYSLWGGTCASQKPTAGVAQASVLPGQSAAATVQEPFLYMKTFQGKVPTDSKGNYTLISAQPAHIVLTYACGERFLVTPAQGIPNKQTGYQDPPPNGWLSVPGEPYAASGGLTVCADIYSSNTWYQTTVTTGNASMTTANTVPDMTVDGSQTGTCPGVST